MSEDPKITGEDPKATVEKLRAAELELEDRLAGLLADLATAREREASAVLNAALGNAGKQAGETASVLVETIAALRGAIAQARAQRVAAIKAACQADAAELRRQAAAQRAAAETHAAKVAELLVSLRELEGVGYMPDERAYFPGANPDGSRIVNPGVFVRPNGELLCGQAMALEHQAAAVDTRQVRTNGHIEAASRDQLVAQVRGWDPFALAPTLHLVSAWLDEREAVLRQKLDSIDDRFLLPENRGKLERTYSLAWSAGAIDPRASRIETHYRNPVRLYGIGSKGEGTRQTVDEIVGVAAA
jgi:hypothetical protein